MVLSWLYFTVYDVKCTDAQGSLFTDEVSNFITFYSDGVNILGRGSRLA